MCVCVYGGGGNVARTFVDTVKVAGRASVERLWALVETGPPVRLNRRHHPRSHATRVHCLADLAGLQPPRAVRVRGTGRCVGWTLALGSPEEADRAYHRIAIYVCCTDQSASEKKGGKGGKRGEKGGGKRGENWYIYGIGTK